MRLRRLRTTPSSPTSSAPFAASRSRIFRLSAILPQDLYRRALARVAQECRGRSRRQHRIVFEEVRCSRTNGVKREIRQASEGVLMGRFFESLHVAEMVSK